MYFRIKKTISQLFEVFNFIAQFFHTLAHLKAPNTRNPVTYILFQVSTWPHCFLVITVNFKQTTEKNIAFSPKNLDICLHFPLDLSVRVGVKSASKYPTQITMLLCLFIQLLPLAWHFYRIAFPFIFVVVRLDCSEVVRLSSRNSIPFICRISLATIGSIQWHCSDFKINILIFENSVIK